MIIGHGDIARSLIEMELDDDRLYFASGVSFSGETNSLAFQREKELLLQQSTAQQIVYFSTLAGILYTSGEEYVRHKREMEALVANIFPCFAIIRLGTLTWINNPTTLINHFREQVARQISVDIQDTTRYVLEKSEFQKVIRTLPTYNCVVNAKGKRMKVGEIFAKYVLSDTSNNSG